LIHEQKTIPISHSIASALVIAYKVIGCTITSVILTKAQKG